MYTYEIVNKINTGGGVLNQEDYIDIYDNSPQITTIFLNDNEDYAFEMWCDDKKEPILFNIETEFGLSDKNN